MMARGSKLDVKMQTSAFEQAFWGVKKVQHIPISHTPGNYERNSFIACW